MSVLLTRAADRSAATAREPGTPPVPGRWTGALVAAALGQAALMVGVIVAYRQGRHLAGDVGAPALRHASTVWHLERWLGLPSEASVQRLALHAHWLVHAMNVFYLTAHFPVTGVFLAWVWFRHRTAWPRVRAALILLTGAALAIHLAYPLAPPRLLPGHPLLDTGRLIGPTPYPEQAGHGYSNQYAAMPSLHIAWAVLVAWGVVTLSRRRRLRWLAVPYPVTTTLVVVITGNHYWLDGIVGVALLCLALRLSTAPVCDPVTWARRRRRARRGVPAAPRGQPAGAMYR
ncbi:MAG: phosphatase PAP2 family protein [Mycobacteriales bacterium]